MKLQFLGTGTSQGIPVVGCYCDICTSTDARDKRFRSSVMISTDDDKKILIDCGPDFRMQMLQNGLDTVDAVLLTHEHNDHVIGLDDMRPIIFRNGKNTDLFSLKRVALEVKNRFPYAFAEEKYPGAPSFDLHFVHGDFELFGVTIIPVKVRHGKLEIVGYKLRNLAYITDASTISPEEKEKLKGLDYLILNCIRKEMPHPAHFILPDIIELHAELKPKKLYLTHISHQFGLHKVEEMDLPENIHLAYDGLELNF